MVQTILTTQGGVQRLKEQDESQSQTPSLTPYLPWGFTNLDKLTYGIREREMTILLGRAGTGKSAFAGLVALNVARWIRSRGIKKVVRIVSLEMAWDDWLQRLACFRAQVPIHRVVTGFRDEDERDRYYKELDGIEKLNIEGIDSAPNGLSTISDFVRYNSDNPDSKHSNCAFWILDHIGIVPTGGDRFGGIDLASDCFRDLSKEVAPSLVLSQMNRASDQRTEKRPTTSDVYGSEKTVQNARKIIALHRDDVFKTLEPEERMKPLPAEVIILKANNGQLGTVPFWFHGPSLNWYEKKDGE